MSHLRQVGGCAAVVLLGVALTALLAGSLSPAIDSGPGENLGEVDGIAYNESLSLTVENGFNETELDRLVARSMARIEVIRGLEFEEQVDVEVITREQYRERRSTDSSDSARAWENLRWEALHVIGQDRDATAVLDEAFSGGVQGYYSLGEGRIVLVSDAEQPAVDTETLVHELVHALQDQQFGIEYNAETADGHRAYESLVEGEAELVPELYFDRCERTWSCVRPEEQTGETELSLGVRLQILAPYAEGQEFVSTVRDRGGWAAVNELHAHPPESSAQVIQPESYPDTKPVNVTVTDRSTDEWERAGPTYISRRLGVAGNQRESDTLGEAAIYAMFVHNGIADVDDPLGYEHSFSSGWAGDQLVAYSGEEGVGYVWETAWEKADDARQFAAGYRQLLAEQGAVETGVNVFSIPDGPFEDAVRVTQEGRTVRIVNAPTADALDEIHG